MNILLEIYNKIFLSEAVANVASVTDAIKGRYGVTINYKGDPKHGVAPGPRTIQVYVYGLTKAGNPFIRAYQPYGDTASRVPSWKMFRLDRIIDWKPTFAIFNKPAPLFNPNGDRSMSVVYTIVNFKKPTSPNEVDGPRQKYKPVGQLPDIDNIIANRDVEKKRDSQYNRIVNTPRLKSSVPPEYQDTNEPNVEEPKPEIQSPIQNTNLSEPIIGDEEVPAAEPGTKEVEPDDTFKTDGDIELQKFKDLNKRLDSSPIMDLSNRRFKR